MTDNLLLNWIILAISFLNTILLFWLGFTIWLNAEHRDWGMWLSTSELFLGGVFFLSHSISLGLGTASFNRGMEFWWRVGWVPVVTIPYVWYIAMLWFSGFWEQPSSKTHRLHWPWFVAVSMLAASGGQPGR